MFLFVFANMQLIRYDCIEYKNNTNKTEAKAKIGLPTDKRLNLNNRYEGPKIILQCVYNLLLKPLLTRR